MAAIPMAKNAVFNLPKTHPQNPSLVSGSSSKVSRVCFTSASKNPEGRNASEEEREIESNMEEKAKESVSKAKETMKEVVDTTKGLACETKDKTKERAGEMIKDETSNAAGTTANKAKEGAQNVKEKVKEKTNEGANRATETAQSIGQNIGKKAKQTMHDAWGAARETSQKIKETWSASRRRLIRSPRMTILKITWARLRENVTRRNSERFHLAGFHGTNDLHVVVVDRMVLFSFFALMNLELI